MKSEPSHFKPRPDGCTAPCGLPGAEPGEKGFPGAAQRAIRKDFTFIKALGRHVCKIHQKYFALPEALVHRYYYEYIGDA